MEQVTKPKRPPVARVKPDPRVWIKAVELAAGRNVKLVVTNSHTIDVVNTH